MKFKSLKKQIIVIFLSLILSIQLAGLIPIGISINKNAHAIAEKDLQVGESIFINILEHNTDSLKQGAKILAADYGFRESIATNDNETIISALNNHQARINADIAIYYSEKPRNLIISGNVSAPDATMAAEKLIKAYSSNHNQLDFEIFNDSPYQLVAVPIKAPLVIGWVVMGFKINNDLVVKLHKLSNLQVSFIHKSANNHWRSTASTLNTTELDMLVNSMTKHYSSRLKKIEIETADSVYDSRILSLHNGNNLLITVLQRSITEATSQYQSLKLSLLLLTLLGLIIFTIVTFYISKFITLPITELSETAKQLEQGNYDLQINTDRQDEIGDLSKAFNSMRYAIASREQKVTRLAFYDEITGLPNRVAFMKLLTEAINNHQKSNLTFIVIVINLDRFKQINKILGREFADQLLKQVGINIKSLVIKLSGNVARLGADEFAVLLPHTTLAEGIVSAEKLIKMFESSITINEQTIDVTAGVGVSVYPEHGHSDEQLLHNAETALLVSKVKKSGVIVYEKALELGTQENLSLASELKNAIQNNELALYLQPKVNIKTKSVNAAEALIRWIHPEKGFIFPDQFIPFAEQTGIIQKITLWMLEEACKVSANFKQQGINLTIAVNISTRDLIDQNLPDKLLALFEQYQVSKDAISLEITESSIMDDPVRAEATLLKLSQMGIKIAIDDFGTGYSSLAYLKRLPVQELKIDKSFVLSMATNESDATIVRSTIDLGHNLNLKVVAEGIENIDAWQLLAHMGCDDAQGYFMGKPMPVKDFGTWLATWKLKAKEI